MPANVATTAASAQQVRNKCSARCCNPDGGEYGFAMPTLEFAPQPVSLFPAPDGEHDKLGPIGHKSSPLGDPLQLRNMLIRAFEATAQAARETMGGIGGGTATAP